VRLSVKAKLVREVTTVQRCCVVLCSIDDLSLLNDSGSFNGEISAGGSPETGHYPPIYQEQVQVPVYHPTPSQTCLATQLTEDEQIRIAQRLGLIHHLPKGTFTSTKDPQDKTGNECVICMMDFAYGDPIRFLPCLHIYHVECIDEWLMRSFTCPSCMEPVDAALLSSYETHRP
uniref:Ring finger protein 11a n=1 Tax=Callorhinchus milii TaxID=7868 RepID=A0A4W3H085_CALMI